MYRYHLVVVTYYVNKDIGRGDRAPVVLGQSHRAHTRTVKLRFYNILTTANTTNLESLVMRVG